MSAKKLDSGVNLTKELTVQNKLGIHARPAALFVKTANQFSCDIFVEKDALIHHKAFFHDLFFRKIRSSQFTLCPAGDSPWSMRFFEAIMCRSIPIVSDMKHTGRNDLERSIGYRVFLPDADHVYDEGLAEENFQTFLRHQTLIKTR